MREDDLSSALDAQMVSCQWMEKIWQKGYLQTELCIMKKIYILA
jgi:hypothetical protein